MAKETREAEGREYPVISEDDWDEMWKTNQVDYQGYVRAEDGREKYVDGIITKDIGGNEDTQVSIKGNQEFGRLYDNDDSPENVDTYDLAVFIPGEMAKEQGVVFESWDIKTIEDYKEEMNGEVSDEDVERVLEGRQTYSYRFQFDATDEGARELVKKIHDILVKHIEENKPLVEIPEIVEKADDKFRKKVYEEQVKIEREEEAETEAKKALLKGRDDFAKRGRGAPEKREKLPVIEQDKLMEIIQAGDQDFRGYYHTADGDENYIEIKSTKKE